MTPVAGHRDPTLKRVLRGAWRQLTNAAVPVAGRRARNNEPPRVFYGGALGGNVGGGLVKVARLQKYFPECRWGFNILYNLSNTSHLGTEALAALQRRGVGIIHNQNGVFYPGWFQGDWEEQNKKMGIAYHRADHVFWQSEFCRTSAERFLGPRQGPAQILYNAVDTGHFTPPARRVEKDTFTFLLTGKVTRHLAYRVTGTITALSLLRAQGVEAELHIAGWVDAETRKDAADHATRQGVSDAVRFSGPYTQDGAPQVYRDADAYIMTKYMDPCPNTVIEAMACGLPVVYSASGGVPELVGPEAGCGVAVPQDWNAIHVPEPEALAEAMACVIRQRESMSDSARTRAVARFDIANWIAAHRNIFETLLGRNRIA